MYRLSPEEVMPGRTIRELLELQPKAEHFPAILTST
jgi:hypothetical protein